MTDGAMTDGADGAGTEDSETRGAHPPAGGLLLY